MRGRLSVLAVSVAAVSGCYVYTPAPSAPAVGTHVLLEINDRGRVGLGDSIGSGAKMIEGTTIMSPDSAYALRVSRIQYLTGQSNSWTGERLMIPRMFVTNAREEKFSTSRSVLAGTLVTTAIVTFITSRNLLGFGTSPTDKGGTGGGGQQ